MATTTDSDTIEVTVANVAPVVTLDAGNDLNVDEGSTHTYSFSIFDPGDDTITGTALTCGVGGGVALQHHLQRH